MNRLGRRIRKNINLTKDMNQKITNNDVSLENNKNHSYLEVDIIKSSETDNIVICSGLLFGYDSGAWNNIFDKISGYSNF